MSANDLNDPARKPVGNGASGALEGVRVLELGQLIAGPFCGQLLADLGAEVIKIELPGRGDPMREWGKGEPVWWPVIARNKKCITLDVRSEQGKTIMEELVKKADIVLENFRPGTMEKWGLGYADLARINKGIVMVRVSGYGQEGPYSARAGYGGIGEAMGGLRYIVGDPSTPPSRVGISIGDTLAAMFAAIGALSALQSRNRTGQGQVVDSAIFEAVLGVMESTVPEYDQLGTIRERTGSILAKIAPSNVYPTADNDMIIMGANQDTVFARLCEAMRQPGLAQDEKYSTHTARGENQAELDDLISAWTGQFAADELLALLENMPCRGTHLPGAGNAERRTFHRPGKHRGCGASKIRQAEDAECVSPAVGNTRENKMDRSRPRPAQPGYLPGIARLRCRRPGAV